MEAFLSQNLLWIVLAIAGVFVFSRMHGGRRGSFGSGHGGHGLGGLFGGGHGLGGLFGGGHGGHGGGFGNGDHGGPADDGSQTRAGAPWPLDPVSRNPVDPARALSSVYGGRAYYFESPETRAKFEAAPSSYASAQPDQHEPSRRRHGC